MTAGFTLGERHRRAVALAVATRQSQQPTPVTWPSTLASGAACPPETLEKSAQLGFSSDLRQVLKIQTANGTIVWICTDASGRFYYQSKTGGLDTALIQDQNGLFLYQVTELGVDDYVAVDDKGTRIEVTRKLLVVRRPNGKTQTNTVLSVE